MSSCESSTRLILIVFVTTRVADKKELPCSMEHNLCCKGAGYGARTCTASCMDPRSSNHGVQMLVHKDWVFQETTRLCRICLQAAACAYVLFQDATVCCMPPSYCMQQLLLLRYSQNLGGFWGSVIGYQALFAAGLRLCMPHDCACIQWQRCACCRLGVCWRLGGGGSSFVQNVLFS